jgi:prefoldin subunit 4
MSDSKAAEQSFARGNKYYKEGDYDAAVKEFSDAISSSGDVWKFYLNRALALMRLRKWADVAKDASIAITLAEKIEPLPKTSISKILHVRGMAVSHLGQTVDAKNDLEQALKLDPNNAAAKKKLASLNAPKAASKATANASGRKTGGARGDVGSHLVDDDTPSAEVTWEDQQRINRFGQLSTQNDELTEKVDGLKRDVEHYDDAIGEIEVALDDDACLMKFGEVFVPMDSDDVESQVETLKTAAEDELETLLEQQLSVQKEMSDLKATLYSKFGKSINLDTTDDE